MKKSIIYFTIIPLLLSGCMLVKVNKMFKGGTVTNFTEPVIIPFKTAGHTIIVKVRFNNSDIEYPLIFDTGAMTIIDDSVSRIIGIKKENKLPSPDKNKDVYIGKLKSAEIDNLKIEDMYISMIDFQKTFGGLDEIAVGLLGSNFFRSFIVTIDYAKEELTLSQNTQEFNNLTGVNKMNFKNNRMGGTPMIECEFSGNNLVKKYAIFDIGSPHSFVLPVSMLKELYQIDAPDIIKSKGVFMEWPFWKTENNYIARLKKIKIGEVEIFNVPVFFADTGGNILIGKEFIAEFISKINYIQNEIIIIPSKEKIYYNHNIFSCGLYLKKNNDKIFIEAILEKTPADKYNLRPGDEILEFNSKKSNKISINEIRNQLNDDNVKNINLLIINKDNMKREVILEKEFLFPESSN